jgi:hypothetical protein
MSITEKEISFYEIEKRIQRKCHELGREQLKEILESRDKELAETRDRSVYRHKGKRKTVIKTVMGEVEYERAVYETLSEGGIRSYVYLLDESMGISGSGFMSGLLSEQIAHASCESSYRRAARCVSDMTGQRISHMTAWKVVQSVAEMVEEDERKAAKAAAVGKGSGIVERKLLFEEQDGIWLKLQGKSRKQHGRGREMKLAIAYEGARKVGAGRYELSNKVVYSGFEETEKFQERKEGAIAAVYKADDIEIRLLGGDGARWIRQGITDETVHFQLDPFHRNKAIRQYVKDPQMQSRMYELLHAKDIDMLLTYIQALSNSVEDEEECDGLLKLLNYFTNNKDGLIPFNERGMKLPEPPDGVEYRRMGSMESNVFTIIGNRMKGRRACWSTRGANNLARLLCLKAMNKLPLTLRSLSRRVLPEKYAYELCILTPSKVAQVVGKGYDGYTKAAPPPATPDYRWLRGLGTL